MMHLYSALLCIFVHPKRFTIMLGGGGGVLSWPTTSVQHPLGWCDGCQMTTAPVRSPHTSYRWRGERVIETIKCMLSPHTSYRWRGERGHRDNQVYALTHTQLQVERTRERHRDNSSVCAHHTPATGGEERERHRDNQVYALTTHQLQVERREET